VPRVEKHEVRGEKITQLFSERVIDQFYVILRRSTPEEDNLAGKKILIEKGIKRTRVVGGGAQRPGVNNKRRNGKES